jgi:hypothetical protein
MTELDLHLKLEKCRFAIPEVDYLGMIIKPRQLAMDPVKLDSITSWSTPTKVRDVRSFLGFTNFYRYFIPDYSNIAHPLIDLTKKNLPWEWIPHCQTAFNTLKALFLFKPVLCMPDLSAPFAIATNTSKYTSGPILLQTDPNGDWHPCSYLSQSFGPAERNYDSYDRELLAVIRALKSWCCRSQMLSTVTKAHSSTLQVPQVVSTIVQPIHRVPCPLSCGLSLFVCDYPF